jgi:hypothetical protein
MLVLIWLMVGVLLGYFVIRRGVAFGLSVLMIGVVTTTILAERPDGIAAVTADSAGVVVLPAMAPVGCAVGVLLPARSLARSSGGTL